MDIALIGLALLGCVTAVRIALLPLGRLSARAPTRERLGPQILAIVVGMMIVVPMLILLGFGLLSLLLPALVVRRRLLWALVSAVYYPLLWWALVGGVGMAPIPTAFYVVIGFLCLGRLDPYRRRQEFVERLPDGKLAGT